MANWIWYPGDFELYHSMLVHLRRQEDGLDYPSMWHLSRPELLVTFDKDVELSEPLLTTVHALGKGFVRINGGKSGPVNKKMTFPAGKYHVSIELYNTEKFPALFIADGPLATDDGWLVNRRDNLPVKPACEPLFTSAACDPSVFPFSYKDLLPISTENINGGVLYDFGCENYGPVTVKSNKNYGEVFICYGESREEALDADFAIVREKIDAFDGVSERPGRAFRYVFVSAENGQPEISAKLEYLDVKNIASFENGDPRLSEIWNISERTFSLCSREVYLDGIKRDRWSWSGDAYQSYIINRCLSFDEAIIRRTIIAQLGKPPYIQHINTITDYTCYLIIAVYEHYFATGDKDFVKRIWPDLYELYKFLTGRLNEEGYIVQRQGDWIFIDWNEIDKEGATAAEQILLWQVYNSMEKLSEILDEAGDYGEKAALLKKNIMRDFWDTEKGVFIDSFTSGKRNVSRHPNIFAIMYGFVDEKTAEEISNKVLLGNIARPITTPYFKFYELLALAKTGKIEIVQDFIESYWGGMTDLGATTVWEEFDPEKSGAEHYEMYGQKYGKSLCHAWGSGPIALLGAYVAGVKPTKTAYEEFEVVPRPGRYDRFKAVVPVKNGQVTVILKDGMLSCSSTRAGGILKTNGRELPIPENGTVKIKIG